MTTAWDSRVVHPVTGPIHFHTHRPIGVDSTAGIHVIQHYRHLTDIRR
jgi:hypothetical protein